MQAVALLQKVQAQGYFKDPECARTLANDSKLYGVWGRAEFQQLLKQVQLGKQ